MTAWDKALCNARNTYQELERLYGKRNQDWGMLMQATDGKSDFMTIQLKDGIIIHNIEVKFKCDYGHKNETIPYRTYL